nr:hypothetical protein [Tanacetum cinerariifolium]
MVFKKQALGYQNPFHLKKAQRIKPTLYDGVVMSNKHVAMLVIDDEETLILKEESRSRMSEKEKDPKDIKQNISHKPIGYEKLNRLTEDFGKRFTPQQKLSVEQASGCIMFKLDLVSLTPKLLQNKEAHIDYFKYTQEQADILQGIVEQAKAKQPLDNALDFSCCPDCSLVFGLRMFKTHDREPLLAHELCKLDAKADIGIFIGYTPAKKAFRIYKKTTHKIIKTIHVTFNELTAMASEQFSSGPGLQYITPATYYSGLVPDPVSQQPCIPPNRDDWDHLFQPMFNEYFNPPTLIVSTVPVTAATRAVDLADSPVSTSINQDAPSASIPSTQE